MRLAVFFMVLSHLLLLLLFGVFLALPDSDAAPQAAAEAAEGP